jgi:hypothetical protein
MSIFSKIRNAKKAADEHRKAVTQTPADSKIDNNVERPYKHVPTHAAIDSMNIGSSQKSAEMHDRIKIENQKIRALSSSRLRQRTEHSDESSTTNPSITSGIEGTRSNPSLSLDRIKVLQSPKMSSTYRHSTFDALVKTRPRYRSGEYLPRYSSGSSLRTTLGPSVAGKIAQNCHRYVIY